MNEFKSAIIASVIGGFITGLFMMWQNRNNHKHDLHKIDAEEKRLENAVLQAIKTEIETMQPIFNNYEKIITELIGLKHEDFQLKKENITEGVRIVLRYLEKNFYEMPEPVVYNNNCSFIGRIKDNNIRSLIVYFYINLDYFRELIISYKKNQKISAEMLIDYMSDYKCANSEILSDDLFLMTIEEILNKFCRGIDMISEEHNKLRQYFEDVIKSL